METYNVIADIDELKWFFDNILQKPLIHESYAAVFAARYKKLNEQERADAGISRRDAEFMATQTFRLKHFQKYAEVTQDDGWTFDNFVKTLKRFNVDKGAYLTSGGYPLPEKCLTTIFYVNPCDEIKVADEVARKLDETKTAIVKAMLNGKTLETNLQSYQIFGNLESKIKHARAHCKGSVYWLDYDLDCPGWFKSEANPYLGYMKEELNKLYGLGNYVIIDTAGGYHILVKTRSIHVNPHEFCKEMIRLYQIGIAAGCMPYVDDKGAEKFECIVNDSQIPGIPLPGAYQYNRPVRIINKEDFERGKLDETNF